MDAPMPSPRKLLRLCRAHIAVVLSLVVHLAVLTAVDEMPAVSAAPELPGRYVVVEPEDDRSTRPWPSSTKSTTTITT